MDNLEKTCTGPCERTLPATTEYWHKAKLGKYGLYAKCKECCKNRPGLQERMSEYHKERYSRPGVKEKIISHQKERNNIPEVREKVLKKKREYSKEYRARPAVKEHTRVRMQKYHSRPDIHEHNRIRGKAYRSLPENKERIRNRALNRNARKRSIGGVHTPQQIQDQLKRQKFRCYYAACGHSKLKKVNGRYQYHVEHTFPVSRVVGTDIPANGIDYLVLACPACNVSKHDKFPWEWPEGGRLL